MYTIPKKKTGSGCSSEFYKLSSHRKRGFKAFDSYNQAYIAHYNQTKLSEHDLAPKVYSEVGRVRIRNTKQLSKWGYITEIAETICCPGNSCSCCEREDIECDLQDEIDRLSDEMLDYGFYFPDNHAGNVGYITRSGIRFLVCIDTGDESVESEDGPCFCLECMKGNKCRNTI